MTKTLVSLTLMLAAAGLASAAVELTPIRVEETRVAQLVKDDIGRQGDSLKITFALKGPEVAKAVKYGDLKIDEAVDDKGTKLAQQEEFGDAKKFKEFSNEFFRKNGGGQPAAPQIEVSLKAPPRAATKIAKLKGTVSIATEGTVKNVEAAGIKPGDSKKLDIPANAGVTVTVSAKAGKDVNQLSIDVGGDENALESLEVVGSDGQSVSAGLSSWTMNGKTERSLMLQKPLDATMKVVAKIAIDRKVTKVPFEVKDIALP